MNFVFRLLGLWTVSVLLAAARAIADEIPASEPPLDGLRKAVEIELKRDILPFWMQHAPDRDRGGFFGEITDDLQVHANADRGTILNARILWTFSMAYRKYHDEGYLEMARRAYRELQDHLWDATHGGYFWSVTASGRPANRRKQVYAEVFAIYGLTEYFRATHDHAALERAIAVYRLIEAHAFDRANGGYFEAFTEDWQRITDPKQSMMEIPAPKSQNTHLHILEAYTNLLRVWPDAGLRAQQKALAETMLTHVLNNRTHHLNLFCSADWVIRSEEISFGHDIEFSWLITEAADVIGDPDLIARSRQTAVAIARSVLREGVDRDGGIFNEATPRGISDANKDWWPQAEGVVGFVNAYMLSGERDFLEAAYRTWGFIDAHVLDKRNGEWFYSVDRTGAPKREHVKVGFWKCPYHNSRSCFEVIERSELTKGALMPPADYAGKPEK